MTTSPHWIVRLHDRYQRSADTIVLLAAVFAAGFVAGLAVMGAF